MDQCTDLECINKLIGDYDIYEYCYVIMYIITYLMEMSHAKSKVFLRVKQLCNLTSFVLGVYLIVNYSQYYNENFRNFLHTNAFISLWILNFCW